MYSSTPRTPRITPNRAAQPQELTRAEANNYELFELPETVKECYPNFPITMGNILKPDTQFVTDFIKTFLCDVTQKLYYIQGEDNLEANIAEIDDETLFQQFSVVLSQLGNEELFTIVDMYKPCLPRIKLVLKVCRNFSQFLKQHSDEFRVAHDEVVTNINEVEELSNETENILQKQKQITCKIASLQLYRMEVEENLVTLKETDKKREIRNKEQEESCKAVAVELEQFAQMEEQRGGCLQREEKNLQKVRESEVNVEQCVMLKQEQYSLKAQVDKLKSDHEDYLPIFQRKQSNLEDLSSKYQTLEQITFKPLLSVTKEVTSMESKLTDIKTELQSFTSEIQTLEAQNLNMKNKLQTSETDKDVQIISKQTLKSQLTNGISELKKAIVVQQTKREEFLEKISDLKRKQSENTDLFEEIVSSKNAACEGFQCAYRNMLLNESDVTTKANDANVECSKELEKCLADNFKFSEDKI